MSESEQTPRKVRIGLVPVLVLIALIVGAGIWLAMSQNSTPDAAAPAPAATSTAPSSSPTPSASPTATARPVPTADEALTENLGRGYELRDENGNAAPLCDARRFVAPYNANAGEPQPGSSFSLDTVEGFIEVVPYQNDERGYQGVITVHCQ